MRIPGRGKYDYGNTFDYDYSKTKVSKVHFEVRGWYFNYRDKGIRGEKPFKVEGIIEDKIDQKGQRVNVSSHVQAKVEQESIYWGLEHAPMRCWLKGQTSFSLKDLNFEFDQIQTQEKCGFLEALYKQVIVLAYAPVFWPPLEIEDSGGPEFLSKPHEVLFLDEAFALNKGSQQFNVHFQRGEQKGRKDLVGLELIGKIDSPSGDVDVYGYLDFDWAKSPANLMLNYRYRRELIFPRDVKKMTSLTIKLSRE